MKGILSLVLSGLVLVSTSGFAADTKTSLDSKWICSTNASSASTDADKATDKQMSDTAKSAADAYAFAAANCRDCTKITCEVND